MAPTLSKYVTTRNIAGGVSIVFLYWLLRRRRTSKTARNAVHNEVHYVVGDKSPQKMKARVDAVFFRQLRHILSIVIPGPFSGEVGFLLLVALALIARSVCDLWLIHTSTYIEKSGLYVMFKDFPAATMQELLSQYGSVWLNVIMQKQNICAKQSREFMFNECS